MSEYIKVTEDAGEEPIEIPCEADNTVLLATLASLYPLASGLKYRNADSGTMRGLRLIDGKLQPPDLGWSSNDVYYCCFPKENKRKIEDQSDSVNTKNKRFDDQKKCSDLIVLGLAWKTSDKELRDYFEKFGDLLMAQVKKDPKTGFSKGFGFIRFSEYENQLKVISSRHEIDGRWCDVRTPMSKDGSEARGLEHFNKKIFIGRLTSEISNEDLRSYFEKYGDIIDIFIPKPFRGFAFITFKELDSNHALFSEDHIIKGISVHVSNAVPKAEMNNQHAAFGNGKSYGRTYPSAYSSYSTNHANSVTPPGPPQAAAGYSPPATQYDYYPRHRASQPAPAYHPDSSNPYSRYSTYSSADYSPYY